MIVGGPAADAFRAVSTEQRGVPPGRVQSPAHPGTVHSTAQRRPGWSQYRCVHQARHVQTTSTLPAVGRLPADRTTHHCGSGAAFHCLPACPLALEV